MFSSNTSQVSGGYEIQRSLRFNGADSAYLNRTLTTPTDNKKFTLSMWVKKTSDGGDRYILSVDESTGILFRDDTIVYINASGNATTSAVFRDNSAWYHLVFVFDSANATANDRMIVYVNNVRQALGTNTPPSLNATGTINSAVPHFLGSYVGSASFFNGYMTEVNFIDGQALTPSSFGAFDAQTGVWGPKPYAGSYGTNGFYLNFSDNSNTTAATLGRDYSGNGNNWTPNNFSVSAGAGNDSLVDVPTNWGTDTGVGGSVRGNYATLNPLQAGTTTLSNGNLDCVVGTANTKAFATIGVSSGKWYWECSYTDITASGRVGIATSASPTDNHVGVDAFSWAYQSSDGQKVNNQVITAYGSSYTTGDIVGIAFDADTGDLTFYKNGVSQGVAFSGLTDGPYFPVVGDNAGALSSTLWVNFGQRPFAYTAPSGFKALNTQNLPSGTITTSGTFIGNGSADGPFVYLNGVPTAMTINGNAVTFATHADKLANGFKVRTNSSSYNNNGASNSYSITTTGDKFKIARAQPNP